jgi:hypothetical protein
LEVITEELNSDATLKNQVYEANSWLLFEVIHPTLSKFYKNNYGFHLNINL